MIIRKRCAVPFILEHFLSYLGVHVGLSGVRTGELAQNSDFVVRFVVVQIVALSRI